MEMLVAYGFYTSDRTFGLDVIKAYRARYGSPEEVIVFRSIEHSAQVGDDESEAIAHAGIGRMLTEHNPQILIHLATLGVKPISQQQIRQGPIGQQLNSLGYALTRQELSPFEEVKAEVFRRKLASARRMLASPLKYAFLNPEVDPLLYEHLLDQSYAFNIGDSDELRTSMRKIIPSVNIANERKIPFIHLSAAVNQDGEEVIEDEYKSEALEKSVKFIHNVREYFDSHQTY